MEKFSPSSLVSVTTSAHARTKFVCLFVFHSFPLLLSQWRNIQQWDKKKIQKYLWMYIYICVYIYIHAQSLQSCLTLWDPIVYSLPGSSFHGVLQTRILEWVVTPSSRGSSRPRDGTHVSMSPVLAGEFFTTKTTWEEHLGDTHTHTHTHTHMVKNLPANTGDITDVGSILGLGPSPGGGNSSIIAWRIPRTEEPGGL